MSRRAIALAVLALAAVAVVACQDYAFNPVGSCVIQPGSQQETLKDVSVADILFVVDDSFSTQDKQTQLQANFKSFVDALTAFNTDRVGRGLQPLEFHIAITTSSIFIASPSAGNKCVGGNQCCPSSTCSATNCTPGQACGTNGICVDTPNFVGGNPRYLSGYSPQCCTYTPGSCVPAAAGGCAAGDECPTIGRNFNFALLPGCFQGVATDGSPYPAGAFVGAAGNPKVIHFTKDLFTPTVKTADIDARISQFQGNVFVGTCGSGEEQHLQAARLAMQKSLAGTAGVPLSDWPHVGAKLVVVWVGDEDDCSTPDDPTKALLLRGDTGTDSCVYDKLNGAVREIPISEFETFFKGLVAPADQKPTAQRPYVDLGAAFIVSSVKCTNPNLPAPLDPSDTYAPADICPGAPTGVAWCPIRPNAGAGPSVANPIPQCQPDATMLSNLGGNTGTNPPIGASFAAGVRQLQLAEDFRSSGYDVVEASVSENFGPVLAAIANLAKAKDVLTLPTVPASSDITVVRIVATTGVQRTTCTQATSDAQRAGAGWWFINCGAQTRPPPVASGVTSCVFINQTNCAATPGETYSVEYLGIMPPGSGCTGARTTMPATGAPDPGATDCATKLGGKADAWWCYGASDPGTCVCRR